MKKRISILLVVAMLINIVCSFSVAATGEATKPELLIFGGEKFDAEAYGISYYAYNEEPNKAKEIEDGIVLNLSLRNFTNFAAFNLVLKYDPTVLIPMSHVSRGNYEVITESAKTAAGFAQAGVETDEAITGTPSVQLDAVDLENGVVFTSWNSTDGFRPVTATDFAPLASYVFAFQEGKTVDHINASTFSIGTVEQGIAAGATPDLSDGLYLMPGGSEQITLKDEELDYTIDFNGVVLATSKVQSEPTETPAEPTEEPVEPTEEPVEPTEEPVEPTEEPVEPTEEPVEPTEEPVEPTEEPVEPTEEPVEPTEEPVEPTEEPKSSNVEIASFGVSGIASPAEAEEGQDYDYIAEVETTAYSYIWARPADVNASVAYKVVASPSDITAETEFTSGKTAEVKLATGETRYVAFEITAEDGETKEVYIVKLYSPASSDVSINSFGVAGISNPAAAEGQDYDYEAVVETAAYSYIWARPEYTEADVAYAVVDSPSDVNGETAYTTGKTATVPKMSTGDEKYVAFRIIAQSGVSEVYIVKVYRPESSDVSINSFGVAGISNPAAVEGQDYDYEATVTVSNTAYSYIWARPEYTKASVAYAVVDSPSDITDETEFTAGKTVELAPMTAGDEKYVAFEITAQNGAKEVYIVKVSK